MQQQRASAFTLGQQFEFMTDCFSCVRAFHARITLHIQLRFVSCRQSITQINRSYQPWVHLPVLRQFHDGGCSGGECYEGHPQHGTGTETKTNYHTRQPPLLAGLVWRELKSPQMNQITDDMCKRLAVTAKDKIQQHLAAGWWFSTLHNI